jgi:hypothetical protein
MNLEIRAGDGARFGRPSMATRRAKRPERSQSTPAVASGAQLDLGIAI